ncbi:MAG TPA: hypothetical protein EYG70_08940 [Sulfurimonas sp.]|nr:hypothetical protein [Sulfurimonas sp.]
MAGEENRRIMEMQMDALKDEHGVDIDSSKDRIPKNARSANNKKLADIYDDAAEYEAELKGFESELEIVNDSSLADLVAKLNENNPQYEGNYAKEIAEVAVNGVTHLVEKKSHSQEHLALVEKMDFTTYSGELEFEIREILVKRWEFLVEIKKEHIADERAEMKLMGMKPDHLRKVHYNYHGLSQN